jgi:hypothetical protein
MPIYTFMVGTWMTLPLPTVIDADALQISHLVNLYMLLTACLSELSSSGLRRKICRTDVLNRVIQKNKAINTEINNNQDREIMQIIVFRCLPSRREESRNNHSKLCRKDKTSKLQQTSLTFWTSSIVSGLKKSTTFRRTRLFLLPVETEEENPTCWAIYKELVSVIGPVKVVAC